MTATLRGAIVGYGNVAASGHMPFWRDVAGAGIVAVVDIDPARRALFRAAAPDGRAYATVDELLAAETPDFVDICTSPASHAALVEQVLAAGAHVLCEKPLTIAAADTLRLAERAAAAGRVVHTVHNWLEAPVCRKITALIAGGAVGAVRSVAWETRRTQPAVAVAAGGAVNWRLDPRIAGGGILIDHGWHALYCVNAWTGGEPVAVSARLENRRFHDLGVEDTATLSIDYDGGATATVLLSWAADARGNGVVVEGTGGRIEVDGATLVLTRGAAVEREACPPSLAEGSHHPDWFARAGEGFLAAVRGEAPANIGEAVRCSLLIDAAQRSSAAGGRPTAL